MADWMKKIKGFVMQPLNLVVLGLLLVAGAQVLPMVLNSPNWSYWGYLLIVVGSALLVKKAVWGGK